MKPSLKLLATRETQQLAVLALTLASYYVPKGRTPDINDFSLMYTRIQSSDKTGNQMSVTYFPMITGGFRDRLNDCFTSALEKRDIVNDLLDAKGGKDKNGKPIELLSIKEAFEYCSAMTSTAQTA